MMNKSDLFTALGALADGETVFVEIDGRKHTIASAEIVSDAMPIHAIVRLADGADEHARILAERAAAEARRAEAIAAAEAEQAAKAAEQQRLADAAAAEKAAARQAEIAAEVARQLKAAGIEVPAGNAGELKG
jgi:hypothetical protein